MREDDLGYLLGGAVLAALGAQLGAAGLVADMSAGLAWFCFWCGLLPFAYGAALLGFLAPLARRIATRGGTPELVLSAAASMHVALTVTFLVVSAAAKQQAPATMYGAAFPALVALAGGFMLVRASGTRPAHSVAVAAGPPSEPAPGAMAPLPRLSWALAALGVACAVTGLAVVAAAALGDWDAGGELAAAYAGGAVLALAGGAAAFARAIGLPGNIASGLGFFMLLPAGAFVAATQVGWAPVPAALGLTLPYLRLTAEVATRAATRAAA